MLNQSGRKRVVGRSSTESTRCVPSASSRPGGPGGEDRRGQGSALTNARGAGPSEARRSLRGCSRSLVRQACLIPRSPVVVALTRAAADLTSGQAPLVSLGPHRTRSGTASLRSALPPARLAPLPWPLRSSPPGPPCEHPQASRSCLSLHSAAKAATRRLTAARGGRQLREAIGRSPPSLRCCEGPPARTSRASGEPTARDRARSASWGRASPSPHPSPTGRAG